MQWTDADGRAGGGTDGHYSTAALSFPLSLPVLHRRIPSHLIPALGGGQRELVYPEFEIFVVEERTHHQVQSRVTRLTTSES